jgi:undecaprenyl-diphosphatase
MSHGSGAGRRCAQVGLAAAVLGAILLTLAVVWDCAAVLAFDERLTVFTRSWAGDSGWPVSVAQVVGIAAAPLLCVVYASAAIGLLLLAGHRPAAGMLACGVALGVALTELVKYSVARPRPPGAGQYAQDLNVSFPSGHASAGIDLFLLLGLILTRLGHAQARPWMTRTGWTLVVLGPMIGVTRLVLGVHWPSDILGGWAYGSVAALIAALLLWRPLELGWGHGAAAASASSASSQDPETAHGPGPGGGPGTGPWEP